MMEFSSKFSHVNSGLSFFNGAKSFVESVHKMYTENFLYSLTVTEEDSSIYYSIPNWVASKTPNFKPKSTFTVSTFEGEFNSNVALYPKIDKPLHFKIGPHRITVKNVNKQTSDDAAGIQSSSSIVTPAQYLFTMRTVEAREALLKDLSALLQSFVGATFNPHLHIVRGEYGGMHTIPLVKRELDSVVLRDGLMQSLVDDISDFIGSETDYTSRGIPWHRGYLLSGPPGTGKTSVIKALAAHFNRDLYFININDIGNDSSLMSKIYSLGRSKMVCLEDLDRIDTLRTDRADVANNKLKDTITLAGLLNALDGIGTPNGMIVFATANEPDKLSPALLRPGRIDRIEEVGLTQGKQVDHMFEVFYGRAPSQPMAYENMVPAAVTEIFKKNMRDPDNAELTLMKENENASQ